jgi:hypothetical protein
MKKLLLFVAAAGLLTYAIWSQWMSFEHMGQSRFATLNRSAKEVVVGVCWPFSVNQDGMRNGLQLALDEINANNIL